MTKAPGQPVHVTQVRVQQGKKLRALYRSLGWSRADCGKFLHVTERCLHNWEAGRHPVPFWALRLLRLHCGFELPGARWAGWSISRGKLCTPEGHELDPHDAKWWGLLVRRAQTGSQAWASFTS
ncbi:VC1465 family Xer recombination activation factor [Ottowia sp.]|uniref:VC1465 family Xer recombination activation factor n=1 Tax=Ottowia sp. TaxID=1898956 RepID=UPI00260E2906|nr:VC1465 family Xer recombination activation factor [Ottowia sp.]